MIYVTKYGASMASYRPSEVEVARAERQEQINIKETAMEVAVQKVEELIKGAERASGKGDDPKRGLFHAFRCHFVPVYGRFHAYCGLFKKGKDVKSYEKPWFFPLFFS